VTDPADPADPAEGADTADRPPLVVIKGDATDEEVAALVAVVQAMAAAGAAAAGSARPVHRSAWADPARAVRSPLPQGPGAWRASGLPR
jgi:hypothetical protein